MADADNVIAPATGGRFDPRGASMGAISAFAEKIARGLGFKPGDALEPVVSRLKGTIEELPFDDKDSGKASIVVKKGGEFVIRLRSLFPLPLQRRMSIVHELGHFFLHSHCGEIAIDADCGARGGNEIAENEAHEFACAFLMPAESLRRVAKEFDGDSVQVAAHFMVPESIVQQRMLDIGC